MSYYCFQCGSEQSLSTKGKAGFRETCLKCSAELHCCKNCAFYDTKAYNECRESQAERQLDKEKGNYCDYFSYREGRLSSSSSQSPSAKKGSPKNKLDDLFK